MNELKSLLDDVKNLFNQNIEGKYAKSYEESEIDEQDTIVINELNNYCTEVNSFKTNCVECKNYSDNYNYSNTSENLSTLISSITTYETDCNDVVEDIKTASREAFTEVKKSFMQIESLYRAEISEADSAYTDAVSACSRRNDCINDSEEYNKWDRQYSRLKNECRRHINNAKDKYTQLNNFILSEGMKRVNVDGLQEDISLQSDSSNRVEKYIDEDGYLVTETYDEDGRMTTKTIEIPEYITTETYDEDGRMTTKTIEFPEYISTETYDEDGRMTTKTIEFPEYISTETYDESGRIISEICTYKTGNLAYIYEYTYGQNGAVIRKGTDYDREIESEQYYHYDGEDLQVVKECFHYSDGDYSELTYHENGELKKTIRLDGIGRSERTYNEKGILIEGAYSYLTPGKTRNSKCARDFYDDNGVYTGSEIEEGFDDSKVIYVKDEKGLEIRKEVKYIDGRVESTEYAYDENDNLISETYKDSDGKTHELPNSDNNRREMNYRIDKKLTDNSSLTFDYGHLSNDTGTWFSRYNPQDYNYEKLINI